MEKRFDPITREMITFEMFVQQATSGLPESAVPRQYPSDFYDKLREEYNELMTNPKTIKRLSSHTYELPIYKITENGAEDAGIVEIDFCKGNKLEPGQEGVFTESLIQLCANHLESVNVGHLENDYTTAAIAHLKTALEILDERVKDRENRGVLQTYNK